MPNPNDNSARPIALTDASLAVTKFRTYLDGLARDGTGNTHLGVHTLVPQAEADAIAPAVPQTAPDPAQVWRNGLEKLMAEYAGMDRARRKAFLTGIDFATASIQLAAANHDKVRLHNAAEAFRHLAATVSGAAIGLESMERAKKRARRR
jgi:hypothetical protein